MVPHVVTDTSNGKTVLFVAVRDGTGAKTWCGVLNGEGLDERFFVVALVDVELHVPALQTTPAPVPAILIISPQEVARVRDGGNSRLVMDLTDCRGKKRIVYELKCGRGGTEREGERGGREGEERGERGERGGERERERETNRRSISSCTTYYLQIEFHA